MATLDVDKFCKLVFQEGTISTLIGLPGAGKTNLAVNFMDIATLRGYNVYTNIGFFGIDIVEKAIGLGKLPELPYNQRYLPKNTNIHTVKSLSDLFIGLLSTERNITILDEAGIHVSSGRATSGKVQTWKELAFIIRHLSSSFMLLAQSKKSVVPDLRETLVEFELRVRKLSPRNRSFSIATATEHVDDFTGESMIVFDVADGDEYDMIPLARYPFDSKDFPYFETDDVSIHEALKALKQFDSITVREHNHGVNAIRALTNQQTAKIKSEYLSTGKYAKIYNVSPKTVRAWCKANRVDYIETESGVYRVRNTPPRHKTDDAEVEAEADTEEEQ